MSTPTSHLKKSHLSLIAGLALAFCGYMAAHAVRASVEVASHPELAAVPLHVGVAAESAQEGKAAASPTADRKGPGTWFLHEHHSGAVAVPGKAGKIRELKCETCHAVSPEGMDTNKFPGPDLEKYPETAKLATTGTKVNHVGFVKAHSACNECHEQLARGGSTWQCVNCHGEPLNLKALTLMAFPNPEVELSQFADKYSHKQHKDYIEECRQCHTPGPQNVKQTLPQHAECFVCHSFDTTKGQPPLANDCTGCHANLAENKPTVNAKLKPPKNAANAVAVSLLFDRYVVDPARPKPPFNHVGSEGNDYHEVLKPDAGPQAGETIRGKDACVFCHASALKAGTREQMERFAAKAGAPSVIQPPGQACTACHVHADQMAPPERVTKATTAKCLACHTTNVVAKPAPPSHTPTGGASPPSAPTRQ
jgi:hypothetical protein